MASSFLLDNDKRAASFNAARIIGLDQQYGLPDFVRKADPENREAICANFVDRDQLQYPCGTKAAFWLSMADYVEHRAGLSAKQQVRLDSSFQKFAKIYNMVEDFKSLLSHNSPKTAAAEPVLDDRFYMLRQGDERMYPLRDAVEVKRAAAWLCEHYLSFDYPTRRDMASRVLDRAAETGAAIDNNTTIKLEKQAGRAVCNAKVAAAQLRLRESMLGSGDATLELRRSLRNTSDFLSSENKRAAIAANPEVLLSLVETLENIDNAQKWNLRYKEGHLLPPEEAIYGTTHKEAQIYAADLLQAPGGQLYSRADLNELSLAEIQSLLSNRKLASAMTLTLPDYQRELATTLETLNGDAGLDLRTKLAELGVIPVAQLGFGQKMNDAEYAKLAALASSLL